MDELEDLLIKINNMILGYKIGLSTIDDKYHITKEVATTLTNSFIEDLEGIKSMLLGEEQL